MSELWIWSIAGQQFGPASRTTSIFVGLENADDPVCDVGLVDIGGGMGTRSFVGLAMLNGAGDCAGLGRHLHQGRVNK